MRQRTVAVLAGAAAFFAAPVRGDEIRLMNGDRLTGTVVQKHGASLLFRTPFADRLEVPWELIETVRTDQPVNVVLDDGTDLKATLEAAGAGEVRLRAGAIIESKPFSLSRVRYINPAPEVSGKGVKLTGRLNFGSSTVRGNSDNDRLHLDAEALVRTRDNRFTLGGETNRAKDSGRETESNARGHLKYDHFFTQKWFGYTNATFERDRFKDLNLRTTLGLGSGYQFLEGSPTNLSLEGGLSYVNEDFRVAEDDRFPGLRWGMNYDHLLFGTRFQFFHNHEGIVNLEKTGHVLLRTRTGLRVPFTSALTGTVQLNADWDKEPPPGRKSTDRALLLTVGYRW